MVAYIPRLADGQLQEKLERTGAVLVRGPKWCGKTSTCEQQARSALKMRDPDAYAANMEAAQIRPSLLLRGERPRLIDEWQVAPVLWDAVINEVDAAGGQPGQFVLTGSATPFGPHDDTKPKHTGTGRIARIDMDTMTLEESGVSSNEVSLSALFGGQAQVEGASNISVEQYAELICAGGWPSPIARGTLDTKVAKDYIGAICESDISEAAGVELDPLRARALLRSLARNSAQEASLATLLADVKDVGVGMSEPTLRSYLNALRKLFVIEDIPAWAPTLRSRTPLRSSATWHLCDPSLAAAALEASPDALLNDLVSMGYLFETLCVRDLRSYVRCMDGSVAHYRDKSGLEADVILRLNDGRWAAVEVKLGGAKRIDEGASNLLTLAGKIDQAKSGAPAFLAVVTGGRYAYTREDGVHVIPLGCLSH
ncbi:AAA family ATPase [Slackia equolifaciens]|uniref:AAA family ATPase n=1 Tax=Slackia equolifaciens TaxID=498718 RepID=A0A3N0B0N3_9ACTN|nr:DUF4143 domain-containing protein [Slackia equolifaciens]RNL40369.1 AAA family ATPase [Slackia equolifaciens]